MILGLFVGSHGSWVVKGLFVPLGSWPDGWFLMVGLDWNGWDKGVEGIVYSMLFVLSDLRQIKRDNVD